MAAKIGRARENIEIEDALAISVSRSYSGGSVNTTTRKIHIVLADSNTLLREGLRRILQDSNDFSILGDAANDVDTMNVVQQAKPDVLLLDLHIPRLEAVPIILAVREQKISTKVLILTLLPEESQLLNTARAGARGYVLKTTNFATLAEAIAEVARGTIWVDRHTNFADTFALLVPRTNAAQEATDMKGRLNPFEVLSKKELQVLMFIAKGETNEEISRQLSIRPLTVKTHATRIFKKLNVKNRTQATLLFLQTRSGGQNYIGDSIGRQSIDHNSP